MLELTDDNKEAIDTFMATYEQMQKDYINVTCNFALLKKVQSMADDGRFDAASARIVLDITLALLADEPLIDTDRVIHKIELYTALINMNNQDQSLAGEDDDDEPRPEQETE